MTVQCDVFQKQTVIDLCALCQKSCAIGGVELGSFGADLPPNFCDVDVALAVECGVVQKQTGSDFRILGPEGCAIGGVETCFVGSDLVANSCAVDVALAVECGIVQKQARFTNCFATCLKLTVLAFLYSA